MTLLLLLLLPRMLCCRGARQWHQPVSGILREHNLTLLDAVSEELNVVSCWHASCIETLCIRALHLRQSARRHMPCMSCLQPFLQPN